MGKLYLYGTDSHREGVPKMTAKAAKTRKICSICNLRPIPSLQVRSNAGMSTDADFCVPCFDEAGWENHHSDYAHDSINTFFETTPAPETCSTDGCSRIAGHARRHGAETKAEAKIREEYRQITSAFYNEFHDGGKFVASERESMKDCWICHPELNEAKRAYAERQGTSRKGQVIHVPLRASGPDKAAIVAEAITNLGGTVKVRTVKGDTTLKGELPSGAKIELHWDFQGRYEYAPSSFTANGGKANKVRNVSEALRLLGK